MMARRKMSSGELAARVGITQANLSILKTNKAKARSIKKFIDNNFYYDYETESLILDNLNNNSNNDSSSNSETNKIVNDVVDTDLAYNNGKGVCFHFSSLFSSMMKSIGVTTREVRGYSWSTDSAYHSWNEYLDESGNWIPIEVGTKVLNNKVYRDDYSER